METFVQSVLTRLGNHFRPEALADSTEWFLIRLITAAIIVAGFYLGWKALQWMIVPLLERSRLDQTAVSFVESIIKYSLLGAGIVVALSEFGIRTTSLLASLGVIGLTLGFAARDALSNMISGLFIFLDRPFVIGDLIEVGEYYGRVHQITLRSTRVVTVDGRMLAIPNSQIVNSTVVSYTNFPHLRLEVSMSIGVEEDIGRVRKLLLDLVRENEQFLDEPAPQVVVAESGDYFIGVKLLVWIGEERQHIRIRNALREAVLERFRSAGVHMPYETLQIQPLEVNTSVQNVPTGPPEQWET